MNKFETIEDFEIRYRKYPFSKSIKISLKKEKSILVTMPYFCPYKKARDFLLSNFSKIKEIKIEKKIIKPDFKTKFDSLKIIPYFSLKTRVFGKIVNFYYPQNEDFYSDKIQKELNNAYYKALRIEAEVYLKQRLQFLANKFDFSYNRVFLRNQKTRFGSCSYYNDISLNINLMKYDFDVIDYVLIHELCHTRVKNHSKKFWCEVEKYCPDYKLLQKRLNVFLN